MQVAISQLPSEGSAYVDRLSRDGVQLALVGIYECYALWGSESGEVKVGNAIA